MLFLLLVLIFLSVENLQAQKVEIHGDTLHTVLKPGDIPAIFNPQFISIYEADTFYYDLEPLLVVESGQEVKAYSLWHLDQHEVVNDYIGGTAIVSTW